MGLTGGIADVGGLYDCLVGIYKGQAEDSILDKWDQIRREIWHTVINPISTENLKRLYQYSGPDEALEKDPFLAMMKKAEARKGQRNGNFPDEEEENVRAWESNSPPLPPFFLVDCFWDHLSSMANTVFWQPGFPPLRYDMTQHYHRKAEDGTNGTGSR